MPPKAECMVAPSSVSREISLTFADVCPAKTESSSIKSTVLLSSWVRLLELQSGQFLDVEALSTVDAHSFLHSLHDQNTRFFVIASDRSRV